MRLGEKRRRCWSELITSLSLFLIVLSWYYDWRRRKKTLKGPNDRICTLCKAGTEKTGKKRKRIIIVGLHEGINCTYICPERGELV